MSWEVAINKLIMHSNVTFFQRFIHNIEFHVINVQSQMLIWYDVDLEIIKKTIIFVIGFRQKFLFMSLNNNHNARMFWLSKC